MRKRRELVGRYKLIAKLPVPCEDLLEWTTWLETADGRVARDQIGGLIVSTVFLGLDHNFRPHAKPGDAVLFETMVFADDDSDGEGFDGYQQRYRTWDEAERGHAEAIEWAREQMAKIERATAIPER